MRVLITGGAGFIGSHVADALLGGGHTVRALDSLSEQVHGSDCDRPGYLDPDNGNRAVDAWDIATVIMHAFMDGVDVPEDETAPEASNEVAPAGEGEPAGVSEA